MARSACGVGGDGSKTGHAVDEPAGAPLADEKRRRAAIYSGTAIAKQSAQEPPTMLKIACLLVSAVPLLAQGPFRTTRLAGTSPISVGDKFAVGDIDADGDLDIVVANDNSPNQILLNDGRGKLTDATAGRLVHPSGPNATHSVDLVDIDGDRDLDILFGNDDFLSNRVYVNNGAGVFTDTTATALPLNAEWTNNQVVADFDGDGDVDWFTVDTPNCHLYRNNGAGVFTDVTAQFVHNLSNLGERYQIAGGADIDGDGDIDIMVPGSGSRPYLIENRAGHLWPATTQLPTLAAGSFVFHWFADLDNDGDQDLLVDRGRLILQNRGGGTFVDVTATAFPGGHTSTFAFLDVDGDRDLDALTAQVLWLNDGTGRFAPAGAGHPLAASRQLSMHAADFDGDGDLDIPPYMNFTRQVDAAAAPQRGVTYALEVHTRAGGSSYAGAYLAFGESAIPLGALGYVRLDPTSLVTIAAQFVPTSPLTLPLPIPNVARLLGTQLHFQALIVDPVTGPHLSNAVREVVQ